MGIPKPTAERLSQLARLLEPRAARGKVISSAEIERLTGWPSHTIRKDISALSQALANAEPAATDPTAADFSTTSGYDPAKLILAIRAALGFSDEPRACCIVGLGRLGSAFLEYSGFKGSSFELAAGFDSNVNRVEILKADFPLYPAFKMKEVIERLGIRYAILCVPPAQAQATADRLIECGILGIVNFTPAILSVPHGIEVENVSVIDALGSLTARLATTKKTVPNHQATDSNERSEK